MFNYQICTRVQISDRSAWQAVCPVCMPTAKNAEIALHCLTNTQD